jgi:protein-L-isoaspartate(D-aspartate) O-methyltransferase
LLLLAACRPDPPPALDRTPPAASAAPGEPDADALRAALVAHLRREGMIRTDRVADAMLRVPRHLFVPGRDPARAYVDVPLPIGAGQTISQPAVVAQMTEALALRGGERVLEIGTGSGYQAAILSLLAARVSTIEIVPSLGERARERLSRLGYANVEVRIGDGYAGWPERAPFDRILLTAAPERIPEALLAQLAEGGILVAPIGPEDRVQRLVRLRKTGGLVTEEDLGAVMFVPMVRPR